VSPSGGAVSATLGTQTVTVKAPAGALSGAGTVTLTVYSPGSAPKALQTVGRKVQTIGSGAILLAEFSVAVSGATLVKPLQATLSTAAAASGSIFRLAGFGTAFDDVDTVTWAAGTATSDLNVAYPRMSLATAPGGTVYAFYVEPAGSASAVPTPVIAVAGTPANPVGMFGNATFGASEASPNGFPYLDPTFAFTLDNASLGAVNASTGAFTAGGVDGVGNIIATDPTAGRGNPHGSGQVTVSSQRPGNKSDTFSFTGTLTSTTQLVNRNPTAPQTDVAAVSLNSTVSAFTPVTGGGQSAVHSTEVDAYQQLSITTGTDSAYVYAPSGPHATVSIKSSDAKDSNGAEYITNYGAGNGLLDVLPEAVGSFGPNNAALTYKELDPAQFQRTRTVAADGSYVEQGTDAFQDQQTVTVNADLSASYDARQYSGLRFTMTAPSGGTNSRIILRIFNAAGTQLQAFSLPTWIPATMTQPSNETDVDNGSVTYPTACKVPSKYGTSGNQIVQTVSRADTALGNLETQTTTTYVAPRVGPVCIQMTDSVQTFYDYTGQNGFSALISGGTLPLILTSLSETLTLQSASTESGTTTSSVTRGTSSLTTGAFAPVAFARARFDHAVREKLGGMRKATFDHNFGRNGVMSL
jgi:hypothetical protein